MMVQCDSADASKMGLVHCVMSSSHDTSLSLFLHPPPLVFQFILMYAKSEDGCLKIYADTSLMVDGYDIDPCKCFGVKWKCPIHEMPCLLKYDNSDDMIYMCICDQSMWPTQDHVLSWDHMWQSGKQYGIDLYTCVYKMCLNGEIPWARKQAEAYVHKYGLCMNSPITDRERLCKIRVLSCGIRTLFGRLQNYV